MVGWDRNESWDRDVLERIAALLFALAALADLAFGLPVLRRRQVLGVLSHGEAEARAFVIGVATGASAPEDVLGEAGDAMRLAASFRALAMVLCVLLARRFVRPGAVLSRVARRKPAEPAGRHATSPAPDTS